MKKEIQDKRQKLLNIKKIGQSFILPINKKLPWMTPHLSKIGHLHIQGGSGTTDDSNFGLS